MLKKIITSIISVLIIAFAIYFFGGPILSRVTTKTANLGNKISKAETFTVAQAEEALPKIIQATIDPPDVHVGDKQKLSIIVESPDAQITSVIAYIETDHSTTTLPLKLIGPVTQSEIAPKKYAVNSDGVVYALAPDSGKNVGIADINSGLEFFKKLNVSAKGSGPLKYENEWTVEDTHDRRYHTIFEVKDSAGHTNSITIAWSDACNIPTMGQWNLGTYGTNCIISSMDGVEAGTTTIATYTLTVSSTFIFNPGYNVVISSGAMVIGVPNGKLVKGYLWVKDQDGDSYQLANSATSTATTTSPAQYYVRRGNLASTTVDCYDQNSQAYPGAIGYQAVHRGDGSFDFNCDGAETVLYSNAITWGGCTAYPGCAAVNNGWYTVPVDCGVSDLTGQCGGPDTTNKVCWGPPYTDPINRTQLCD